MAKKKIPKENPEFVGENQFSNRKTGKKMKNTKNSNGGGTGSGTGQ